MMKGTIGFCLVAVAAGSFDAAKRIMGKLATHGSRPRSGVQGRTADRPVKRFDELVCFGSQCHEWTDTAFHARLPMPPGYWRSLLRSPSPGNASAAVCDARFGTPLRCTDLAPGAPCNKPEAQRCTDLPELRGPLQASQERAYAGTILELKRSWLPPHLPRHKNTTHLRCHSSGCLQARDVQPPSGDWITRRLDYTEAPDANGRSALRQGYVPMLQQEVHSHGSWPRISQLPCSSARMEDAVVLRSFFVDTRGRPLDGIAGNATFLEMGAFDGLRESESLFFERCLGFRGILVEAHPLSFQKLLSVRKVSLNVRLAVCARFGWVNFTGPPESYSRANTSRMPLPKWAEAHVERYERQTRHPMLIRCGPLGHYLHRLGVDRIDYMSLDVEGSELAAVKSLIDPKYSISVGVLMVEVRGDGQRKPISETLLAAGLHFVGQIYGRPSPANEVVSDVFLNLTHMRLHFPASRVCATESTRVR